MGDFFNAPSMRLNGPPLTELNRALSAAVPYEVHGPGLRGTNPSGLNLYFPMRSVLHTPTAAKYQALNFSPAVKQWVARYSVLARTDVVAAPPLGDATEEGSQAVADVGSGLYATGFAALQNSDGVVYALKPLDGTQATNQLRAEVDSGWFSVNGVPVLMLPDESQFAAGRGQYTIPVAYAGANGSVLGLLNVAYSTDAQGQSRYEIESFVQASDGANAVAKRSTDLPLGTQLFVVGYEVETDDWFVLENASFNVPQDAQTVPWLVQKTDLAVPPHSLRLGVNDYLGELKFSSALP
jgi:hypothetical protein